MHGKTRSPLSLRSLVLLVAACLLAVAHPAHAQPAAGDAHRLDAFGMAMSALAGLVLFIYGVTRLAQGLGDLNSERMRRLTARFTQNRLAGVATGFVATTLL